MASSHDLFESTSSARAYAPLAERMRPGTLDEVVGQAHLLGSGKPLRVAFQSGRPHSMIFWGPPGVGKTTLARLMADGFDAQFLAMSAVLGGVKDIREAVVSAQIAQGQGRRTILRSEEHTSELQSLMRISYAVFCLKKKQSHSTRHIQQ